MKQRKCSIYINMHAATEDIYMYNNRNENDMFYHESEV